MTRGFDGGENTKNDASNQGEIDADKADFETDVWFEWSESGAENGDKIAKNEDANTADEDENDTFEEKL